MAALLPSAFLLGTCLFCVSVFPAAAEYHGHPDLEKKASIIKRIALLPPQIDLYELGAGGIEKMMDWSQTARSNVREAAKVEFAKREHLLFSEFDEGRIPGNIRSVYDETFLLYNAVASAILTHAFAIPNVNPAIQPLFFPWKAREFSYSIGKEMAQFADGADAVLLLYGIDQRSSAGRIALGVGVALLGVVPRSGGNLFTAALIDARSGDILWFSKSIKPYDLRQPEDATKLVIEFLAELPFIGPIPLSQ